MIQILKKKYQSLAQCIEFGEYDRIIAAILGKKISLWTNTLKPHRYRYIMLASHGTGRNAFWHFLQACNAYPMRKFDIGCMDKTAFFSWRKIYGIVSDRDISHLPSTLKFITKLDHKVPVFCLVRDPISIIRSGVNMTLASNLMGGGDNVSIQEVLKSYLESYAQMPHHFIFTTSPKQFSSLTQELIYIDMKELSAQKAFDTMKKVCQKIGLPAPDSNEIFSKKIADSLALNIEKDFFFSKNKIMPCDVYLKILPYENTLHKKFIFLVEKFSSPHLQEQMISICLIGKNKRDIRKKILKNKNALDFILEKINDYAIQIKEKFARYEELKINENDVLKYFENDPVLYDKFNQLLEYEVSGIRKNTPQIPENWVYYNKFLSIKIPERGQCQNDAP
ncbi:DUF2972 domain-containing protein [Helicobacter sp. 12S02232-10]|uniref:DUF2972 domain-containing protein n=1 Tax=Helicobacter sp. 12S02232-10 TaxID=1476197 RepID=UPI00117A6E3A|nr:DUF2972 domain-containing protein [Helicobacter sp. 12S02232-10]